MSVNIEKLSDAPVSIGCYRRRIVEIDGGVAFTSGRSVMHGGNVVFEADAEIMDIARFGDKTVCVTAKGDVIYGFDAVNKLGGHVGIYAAVEVLDNAIVAGHDLTHTLRVVDPTTMETSQTFHVRGMIGGLSRVSDDAVVALDDKSIVVFDLRNDHPSVRSPPLPAQPVAVLHHNNMAVVSCDDRRIRVYDIRKMKAPLLTTKPATKNGAMALYTKNGSEIVCVGCDESMTLIDTLVKVGHRKRSKHLVESPWVSAPVEIGEDVALLTRNGIMHRFTAIDEYLKGIGGGDDSSDGE